MKPLDAYSAFFGSIATLLIAAAFILVHGMSASKCNPSPWRTDLKYGDEVVITGGFFEGTEGVIEAQAWKYNADSCNEAAFKLSVYNKNVGAWQDATIEQANLRPKTLEVDTE